MMFCQDGGTKNAKSVYKDCVQAMTVRFLPKNLIEQKNGKEKNTNSAKNNCSFLYVLFVLSCLARLSKIKTKIE